MRPQKLGCVDQNWSKPHFCQTTWIDLESPDLSRIVNVSFQILKILITVIYLWRFSVISVPLFMELIVFWGLEVGIRCDDLISSGHTLYTCVYPGLHYWLLWEQHQVLVEPCYCLNGPYMKVATVECRQPLSGRGAAGNKLFCMTVGVRNTLQLFFITHKNKH